jgi:hypothetical protein
MSQYRDELYAGGGELIRTLEAIRDGCPFLEIGAAI